jgi:hypothetical protein
MAMSFQQKGDPAFEEDDFKVTAYRPPRPRRRHWDGSKIKRSEWDDDSVGPQIDEYENDQDRDLSGWGQSSTDDVDDDDDDDDDEEEEEAKDDKLEKDGDDQRSKRMTKQQRASQRRISERRYQRRIRLMSKIGTKLTPKPEDFDAVKALNSMSWHRVGR